MPQDKADITAAVGRLRDMNAALADWDRIRQEGEQISREEAYSVLTAEIASLRADNDRLREAIRRLTEQDATLSVQGGNVTVTMDAAPTEDPMAWLAFATDGSESNAVYSTDGEAQAAADAWGWQVMPLYLAPRLTDAQREAVEIAANHLDGGGWSSAALRGLLERMT